MKNGLKMEFEKEKKETSAGHPFSPGGPSGPSSLPRRPTSSLLLFFFFPRGADDRGPPVNLPFPPFLSSSSRCLPELAPSRDPRRARPPPHLPFLSPQSIKAIKHPVIN
jgi:hypothetical protein